LYRLPRSASAGPPQMQMEVEPPLITPFPAETPAVMPQLPAAEGGTAECAEHAERLTYRLHPVPPRVPRGMSRHSLTLNGLGLYASRQKKPSPTWHPAEGGTRGGIMGKMPMPRQVTTQSVSFFSLRPCAFALPFSSLSPFRALPAHPPETEAIHPAHLSATLVQRYMLKSPFAAGR